MNIKELIEKLNKYDPEMEVRTTCDDPSGEYDTLITDNITVYEMHKTPTVGEDGEDYDYGHGIDCENFLVIGENN